MQLYLNHTLLVCTKQVPDHLLVYRLPGTEASAWTDHQRSILLQNQTIGTADILYVVALLKEADLLQLRRPITDRVFGIAFSGECCLQLDNEMPLLLDPAHFVTGSGKEAGILAEWKNEQFLHLLLIHYHESAGDQPSVRNGCWQTIGRANTRLIRSCLLLTQASYSPQPLPFHHTCVSHIKDMIRKQVYGEIGSTELTLADIQQLFAVKQYIQQHIRDSPDTGWLAQLHGISKAKLEKGFNYLFQNSPYRFIEKEKMELAKQELESYKSIKEIARLCGYNNASNFSTAFRRNTGCSPGEYRKRGNDRMSE